MECKSKTFSKEYRFLDFTTAVQHCSLCDKFIGQTKILSKTNGTINAKVMFIAEAPGRLGADRTLIPLFGDRTGDNFESLLGNIGWSRKDIFITNALLCNPRDKSGNNITPTRKELENCSDYLRMTIALINPKIVITLGAIALKSISLIKAHNIELRKDVGELVEWNNRILIPLYHPGPRAMIHRSLAKQRADFLNLAKLIDPSFGIIDKTKYSRKLDYIYFEQRTKFMDLIVYIVNSLNEISYFKLTKMLYLIDLYSLERRGISITGEIYTRQPEGPWPPALKTQLTPLKNIDIRIVNRGNNDITVYSINNKQKYNFDNDEFVLINEMIAKCIELDNVKIKQKAYLSKPMRHILKQEKLGRKTRNMPVITSDMNCVELDKLKKC